MKATVGLSKGGRPETGAQNAPVNGLPTLTDAGIDKDLAKLARKLARLTDAEFAAVLAERREIIASANAKIAVDLLGDKKTRGTQGTGENSGGKNPPQNSLPTCAGMTRKKF